MTAIHQSGDELAADLRHADNNTTARQRAAEQLRPAIRKALADILEVEEKDVADYRDMLKDIRAERRAKQERKEAGFKEAVKYIVVTALGGIGTYLFTHFQNGGGK